MKRINTKSRSRIGDLSEFYAVTWLWDQGYEVFPNAGSQGMVDMVAWHPETEETILIDVKTARKTKDNNDDVSKTRTQAQIKKGVQIVVYNADTRNLKFVRHRDE
jgi:Holliday junction resolvase